MRERSRISQGLILGILEPIMNRRRPAKAGPTYGPSLYLIRVGGMALRVSALPPGGLGDRGRYLISAFGTSLSWLHRATEH